MRTVIAGTMLATFGAIGPAQNPSRATDPVRPGIEAFVSNVPEPIRGNRVGLITNHAGIDRAGRSAIDLIAAHPDLKLTALFAAEHGIRGVAAAGEKVADDRDPSSGLPIFSLYKSEDRGPTPEMLKEIDALPPQVRGRVSSRIDALRTSQEGDGGARRRGGSGFRQGYGYRYSSGGGGESSSPRARRMSSAWVKVSNDRETSIDSRGNGSPNTCTRLPGGASPASPASIRFIMTQLSRPVSA